MQIFGGCLGGLLFPVLGVKLPQLIGDNPLWSNVAAAAIGGLAGVVFIFIVRMTYYLAVYRHVKPDGLRAALRKKLGVQMWPVILMASGIAAFLLLFGGGAIWAVSQSGLAPTRTTGPTPVLGYEIERQLKAIDFMRDRLEVAVVLLGNEGRGLDTTLNSFLQQGKAPPGINSDVLLDYARRVEVELNSLQTVTRNHDQYEYLRRCFPGSSPGPYSSIHPYEAVAQARNLAKEFRELGADPQPATYRALQNNQHYVRFSAAVIELGNWAGTVRNALGQVRPAIAATPIIAAQPD